MKKLLTILLAAGIFGLVACNGEADDKKGTEGATGTTTETTGTTSNDDAGTSTSGTGTTESSEETAHVCVDACDPADADHAHGGDHHACSEECKK